MCKSCKCPGLAIIFMYDFMHLIININNFDSLFIGYSANSDGFSGLCRGAGAPPENVKISKPKQEFPQVFEC